MQPPSGPRFTLPGDEDDALATPEPTDHPMPPEASRLKPITTKVKRINGADYKRN